GTGPAGPHADPARPAPAGPGPGPDRARAAACGPHPPPAPGRPAHRPTRAHRAPPSTPPPAPPAPPGAHPHTPTPRQPLPTPGAAAAHPDGAAARRRPPRAPPRSVSSRRDPTAQLPHQTRKLLIGGSLAMNDRQQSARGTTANDKTFTGLTDEERAAMKERPKELKAEGRRGPRADTEA